MVSILAPREQVHSSSSEQECSEQHSLLPSFPSIHWLFPCYVKYNTVKFERSIWFSSGLLEPSLAIPLVVHYLLGYLFIMSTSDI